MLLRRVARRQEATVLRAGADARDALRRAQRAVEEVTVEETVARLLRRPRRGHPDAGRRCWSARRRAARSA